MTCRLFDLILEVIVIAMHCNLMTIYSGCVNLCDGSCASLCIIDGSRGYKAKDILEINRTVQKSGETIII
jgi:hypothetical protein